MPNNKERLSTLEKALAVLEAVGDQPQAVGLPDLAARLKLPRQTVHRVLGQLQDAGLVTRHPVRERYSVGPRMTRLALAALNSRNQGAPVRAILADLVEDVNETCNIGVLDDLEYVYLERIECKWPLRTHLSAGSRVCAYGTSGGKTLLAELAPEQCKRLLRSRKLEAHTPHTITKLQDLEAEFARIRTRGFALNNQEYLDGIIGLAVPIKDAGGRAVAALAMHGPVTRLSLKACEEHVPRLAQAAERIARVWIME
ncbi:MAG TPA: IclR family transcriptional regulator [Hyphomicrobiaceae bacterium]|nr:IclR family transcriptional regulator [Hyphomicrobiaceae bacterium]